MKNKITTHLKEKNINISITLPTKLTDKETFLLKNLLDGKNLKDIAQEHKQNIRALSFQKEKIYEKLGIQNDLSLWLNVFFRFEYQIEAVNNDTYKPLILQHNFTTKFQPIIDLHGNKLAGYEVSVCQNTPEYRNITPGVFTPAIEPYRHNLSITPSLIKKVICILSSHPNKHTNDFYIAINVTIKNILSAGFEKSIIKMQSKLKINKAKLMLILTERYPFTYSMKTQNILRTLKLHDITFAIGGFGTGYSDLKYLQNYPVDFIKIDYSLVQQAEKNKITNFIVDKIITLAKKININIIAEGMENRTQAMMMRRKGVTHLQGDYFPSLINSSINK